MPAGLRARGGIRGLERRRREHELAVNELDDVRKWLIAREARRLAMSAAAGLARDRGDVDLVAARAQRYAVRRPVVARRLADEGDHLGALDLAQVVDDPLGVRLLSADVVEVAAHEVRDDESAAFEELRPVERTREQLQLCELHRLVHLAEDAV